MFLVNFDILVAFLVDGMNGADKTTVKIWAKTPFGGYFDENVHSMYYNNDIMLNFDCC